MDEEYVVLEGVDIGHCFTMGGIGAGVRINGDLR